MIAQRITHASAPHDNAFVHPLYSNGDPRQIIESLRQKRGFTSVRALAIAAGVSQPNLSRYLNGTSETMELETFAALAKTLEVTLSELLGEVPLSSTSRVREMFAVMEQLPEPEQTALLAAGKAMAETLRKKN